MRAQTVQPSGSAILDKDVTTGSAMLQGAGLP